MDEKNEILAYGVDHHGEIGFSVVERFTDNDVILKEASPYLAFRRRITLQELDTTAQKAAMRAILDLEVKVGSMLEQVAKLEARVAKLRAQV